MAINTDTEQEQPIYFDAIKIGLASPEKIRKWSFGEVTKPETINYRTWKPERDGLFCEKIFGPTKDWECHCGKYKKIRFKGIICDRCGVEVTKSSVRRERMGHIELGCPVSHIWYFKGIPSRMGLLLDLSPRELERVLYFSAYIVTDPGSTDLHEKDILSEQEYRAKLSEYGSDAFEVGMGAEAVKELLKKVDLEAEAVTLREELETATGQKKTKIIKKLDVVEAFRNSGNKPEWMVLDVVPVIPPDLRPMVQLDGGRFATSDLNDLYRRIINRNNRLKRLLDISAPDIIVRNEKRMLQEAVDSLIDNGRHGRAVTGPGSRALKSLSEMLKGKQGRFRQNLLGKRVDYSGRSVIVVGPELKIYQCGLPKEMAIELFKPFVMKELVSRGKADNIKAAKKKVERLETGVWDILEDVIREHPVMLNRAPTLHRLGIQAFEPILVEGKAIKLHPLVCMAFNADFDGDQMAVHLPLSVEAQAECRFLLLSPNNLLKPSDGGVVSVPSQDMVLGIYYLTMDKFKEVAYTEDEIKKEYLLEDEAANLEAVRKDAEEGIIDAYDKVRVTVIKKQSKNGDVTFFKQIVSTPEDLLGRKFLDINRALLAFENKEITLQQKIYIKRSTVLPDGKELTGFVATSLGKLIFNEMIPQDLGFVDRSDPNKALEPEVNKLVKKGDLKKILNKCINIHGATKTAEVLDDIKALGYKYSTLSGISVSIADMTIPADKKELLDGAQKTVDEVNFQYEMGFLTERERKQAVISVWEDADKRLTKSLLDGLDKYNNIYMMADSGARGSDQQIKQLAGMRGLMADTTGATIELPIKSNFREGLDVLEYFISAHGARKGLSDTALRTADSGYLTRRLVDVSQDIIIRETDCMPDSKDEKPGIYVQAFMEGRRTIESFEDRIRGRYAAESVFDANGEMIVKINHMITPARAERVVKYGVQPDTGVPFTDPETGEVRRDAKLKIRSVLSCKCHLGICAKCYGVNLATGQAVQVGEAVGIIAAQSIGEPGTQLTMRTFHSGGVAGGDITQGLPRVEEIFEARKPKGLAIISDFAGKVEIRDTKKKREVVVSNAETGETKAYLIPYGSRIKVQDGEEIAAGDELTEGSVNPHDILKIKGVSAVQNYMLREVQKVYRSQGVEINDKHIEIIVRQMLKKTRIEDAGDSEYLPGTLVDVLDIEEVNEINEAEGLRPVVANRILLGITKASLATNSFLSAASFQETTRVLTDAAIKGKVDPLIGLKENVLIGKLIPAGTGMKRYRSVRLDSDYARDINTDEYSFEEYSEELADSDEFASDDFTSENYDSEDAVDAGVDNIEETGIDNSEETDIDNTEE